MAPPSTNDPADISAAANGTGRITYVALCAGCHGLDGSVMSVPAVPVNEARIRLFVTSEHTPEQIRRCADIVTRAGRELGFAVTPSVSVG